VSLVAPGPSIVDALIQVTGPFSLLLSLSCTLHACCVNKPVDRVLKTQFLWPRAPLVWDGGAVMAVAA
jgi:hypothetical protein